MPPSSPSSPSVRLERQPRCSGGSGGSTAPALPAGTSTPADGDAEVPRHPPRMPRPARGAVLLGALAAAAIGCGARKAAGPAPSSTAAPTATSPDRVSTAPSASSAQEADASRSWTITGETVGSITLGKALPKDLLSADLEEHYVARYIADGVPIDGFRFEAPPILVILAHGPYARLDEQGRAEATPIDDLRGPAADRARSGEPVRAVMIHDAGPVTAAGVGVGSTLAELTSAYPDLRHWPVPPTMGEDDRCAAQTRTMPNLVFLFATCELADAGEPVTRVDLWAPSPPEP